MRKKKRARLIRTALRWAAAVAVIAAMFAVMAWVESPAADALTLSEAAEYDREGCTAYYRCVDCGEVLTLDELKAHYAGTAADGSQHGAVFYFYGGGEDSE